MMSRDYSENILIQENAGHLLEQKLGWKVIYAYNTEKLGENGTFGRKSYTEIRQHIRRRQVCDHLLNKRMSKET